MEKEIIELWDAYQQFIHTMPNRTDDDLSFSKFIYWLKVGKPVSYQEYTENQKY